jgi:hypothetical protein
MRPTSATDVPPNFITSRAMKIPIAAGWDGSRRR